ncbi:MAG: MAPEG family protein [Deltaproteobacteria bacterium]|nr:MAPEG family protein [Deltaproteobacteria bacterium]MBW2393179.1 MAPEG family protein [Deltaproteobacteria bacterium]
MELEPELPALVSVIALLEYMFFAFKVGMSREKFDVPAPAVSGHPEWERLFRVQQNTLEQLMVFLPALWIFSLLIGPTLGAAIGVGFLIGRPIYFAGYVKDPKSRSTGFIIGFLTNAILLLGSLGAAVYHLIS